VSALYRLALLSLVVLLALTACGGDEDAGGQDSLTATTAPATDTPEPTATATEAAPPTEETTGGQVPAPTEPPAIEAPVVGQVGEGEGRREDIPLMPDASGITSVGSEVSYQTASPVKAVAEFYQAEMPKNGWTAHEMIAIVTDFAASLVFHKGEDTATIVIAPSGTGGSRVTIGVQ
jgi:hypothetical protein